MPPPARPPRSTGGDGDDLIYGSEGGDTVSAGAGRDRVYGNGGIDTIGGGSGDDTLDGGAGSDTISGDGGADLLVGGAGDDILFAFTSGGTGDDGAINYVYGDFGTAGNEPGSGDDTLHGGIGNDQLFGDSGTNTINGGGSGALKNNGAGVGTPGLFPAPPVPVPPNWPPSVPGAAASLPTGVDYRGRWTEMAGSATGGGLSSSIAAATDPAIAIGVPGQYVAWTDARTGTPQIYVALHTAVGWQELAGSAHGGGVSASKFRGAASEHRAGRQRPADRCLDANQRGDTDIFAARYDALANAGQGGWVALGRSLSLGGLSGTGKADQAPLVNTASGPVVAWLEFDRRRDQRLCPAILRRHMGGPGRRSQHRWRHFWFGKQRGRAGVWRPTEPKSPRPGRRTLAAGRRYICASSAAALGTRSVGSSEWQWPERNDGQCQSRHAGLSQRLTVRRLAGQF